MYTWIWRRLPGGTTTKLLASLALVVAVSLLLLFVVFPQFDGASVLSEVTVER